MNDVEKTWLLEDLSSRLAYGVKCFGITYDLGDDGDYHPVKIVNTLTAIDAYKLDTATVQLGLMSKCKLETVKPYLRPLTDMTEDESNEYLLLRTSFGNKNDKLISPSDACHVIDWLNEHHFDYRGLIDKGLAVMAPEGTYK